ncbi:hypoxia inducible factor 1 subunit alpha, like 2 isoform X2 [Myxocyprinus asiaticus]|uniref:hypoxia inducible factor 1 subunit alpha, like 2 isoform X2 n=1 Tax=Myxocyprinus asiaticus TaxID=70543 RepID=UPI002221D60B|nr:hypoxia inducible factor 1 subunit alpha, like 2 isoform X2 [Myxocyprinus asiaticus]
MKCILTNMFGQWKLISVTIPDSDIQLSFIHVENRVCTEWRKTCSRLAAQSRRRKESQLFKELTALLPLDSSMDGQRDKASVIRLTIAYMHLRGLLNSSALPMMTTSSPSLPGVSAKSHERGLLDSALGGFVVLLSLNGKVIFTTKNVTTHTGINQMDLIGRSLFEFMHPCDQVEVKDILTRLIGNQGQQDCEVFLRIKSGVNQKLASWKIIQCTGKKISSSTSGSSCLVLQCRALPMQEIIEMDATLNISAFLSIHSPDMKFTYCHSSYTLFCLRVVKLIGFRDTELIGKSVYQYYHPSDCQQIRKAHICLLSKGQVSTGKYRLLHREGGYVWAETDASVVCNSRTGTPESVVCINYILSGIEQPDVAFLLKQTEQLLKPFDSLCSEHQTDTLSAALQDGRSPRTGTTAIQHNISIASQNQREGNRREVHECSEMTHKTEGCCDFTCDLCELDLDSLAPYIPMHGEDFLLTPIYDGTMDSPDLNVYGLSLDSPQSKLSPQLQNLEGTVFVPVKSLTHTQQIISHYFQTNRFSDTSKLILTKQWNDSLEIVNRISKIQYNSQPLSTESETHHWRKNMLKVSQHPNRTHCNYDGSTTIPCGRVQNPLGSKFKSLQVSENPMYHGVASPQNRRHHTDGKIHPTPLTLPVLSRWECEVNAPLDPTSYLLQGNELTAVLDQVASRVPLW